VPLHNSGRIVGKTEVVLGPHTTSQLAPSPDKFLRTWEFRLGIFHCFQDIVKMTARESDPSLKLILDPLLNLFDVNAKVPVQLKPSLKVGWLAGKA